MPPQKARKRRDFDYEDRWKLAARCRAPNFATEDFYPNEKSSNKKNQAEIAAAKAICASCAVKVDCLAYALHNREPDGVWGGYTTRERNRMLRPQDINGEATNGRAAPAAEGLGTLTVQVSEVAVEIVLMQEETPDQEDLAE